MRAAGLCTVDSVVCVDCYQMDKPELQKIEFQFKQIGLMHLIMAQRKCQLLAVQALTSMYSCYMVCFDVGKSATRYLFDCKL